MSPRPILIAALLLFAALPLEADFSTAEIEDAAEFARRAATAALRGQPRVLAETLDVDTALARRVGPDVWERLAPRQKERLSDAVREFARLALGVPRGVSAEVAWAWASAGPSSIDVLLGLKLGERALKTRWVIRRVGAGWKISDIVLVDPGISLTGAAVRALGPISVRRRDRREQWDAVALPRLIGVLVIGAVVLLAWRRVAPEKRILLLLTASAPAILFLVDGALAAARALEEPYIAPEEIPGAPWRQAEQMALQAQREGRVAAAAEYWNRAVAAGAPAPQVAYQQGLLARQQGNAAEARAAFTRALSGSEPAPGAARELALMDIAAGNTASALENLKRYRETAGPDPETLSLMAAVETSLGDTSAALNAVRQARELLGDQWKSAELEARVRARAADAAGTVQALRPLAREGVVDRFALRADPAYLPIATEPAWVAFINERVTPPAVQPTPERPR